MHINTTLFQPCSSNVPIKSGGPEKQWVCRRSVWSTETHRKLKSCSGWRLCCGSAMSLKPIWSQAPRLQTTNTPTQLHSSHSILRALQACPHITQPCTNGSHVCRTAARKIHSSIEAQSYISPHWGNVGRHIWLWKASWRQVFDGQTSKVWSPSETQMITFPSVSLRL